MRDPRYRVRRARAPVAAELEDVEGLLARPDTEVLKDDGRTAVARVRVGGATLVVKRFRDTTLPRALEALALGSGAARVWQGAARLAAAGLPAPTVRAVLERRRLGFPVRSAAISSWVAGMPLDELWQTRRGAARRALTEGFADYLRQLHAAGVYPQDLRAANVVVARETPPTFVLVDLDRVRRYRRLAWRRRRKNLVQVLRSVGRRASRSARLRFLRRYLGPTDRPALRRVVAELLALARRKDAEYARRRGGAPRAAPAAASGRERVSCTIICFDEEETIRDALESVAWCDEIVVVDSFSRDRTVAICREYTDRIYQRPWPGFVEQKAFALEQARHPWVLNLDADERVSAELREEIETVLRQPRADGYYVPRLVRYLGRWWWRGGWYPDYRLRLFRRARAVWGGVDPHEKVIVHGRTARLRGPLLHFTYRDIHDHVATINGFTGVAARELLLRGRDTRVSDLLGRPLWRFVRFYLLRRGFLEGRAGLFVAQSAAFYVFLRWAKLWEARRRLPPAVDAAQ